MIDSLVKDTLKYDLVIQELRKAILLNPGLKHRIILKAIKTAESKEVQKAIRTFHKTSFQR